jgi:flagellar biosynthesis GTPase FlhF
VRQYQASLTELDGQRKAEKEPYRLGGAQVDGFFNEKAEELALLKLGTERLMNAYNSRVAAEARRKAAADLAAKRLAEEVKRKAAAALAKQAADAAEKARGAKTIAKAAAKAADAEAAKDEHEESRADVTRAKRVLAQPAAHLTRARSANAVQSQQEFVDFRDLDRSKISLEALRAHIGIDHLAQAVRSYIAANNDALKEDLKNRRQPLAGVEFFMNSRTRVGGG